MSDFVQSKSIIMNYLLPRDSSEKISLELKGSYPGSFGMSLGPSGLRYIFMILRGERAWTPNDF